LQNQAGEIYVIPKIIHYCWFGGNPKPDDVKRYLASWKQYCPDYEVHEWNESNFDVNENAYCREAYKAKKWAFVADYARVKVLDEYGGIYMDTDVEMMKPFDDLLHYAAFLCFESDKAVSIGTFGAEKGHPLLQDLLNSYEQVDFQWESSKTITNLMILTDLLVKKYHLKCNGKQQILKDNIAVFPMEAFIAKDVNTGWIMPTEMTYAIHQYASSWYDEESKRIAESNAYYLRKYWHILKRPLLKIASCQTAYDQGGWSKFMKKLILYIKRTFANQGGTSKNGFCHSCCKQLITLNDMGVAA
jgi:ATP-dependent exoDNAse (exonuclease V) alpha subunit